MTGAGQVGRTRFSLRRTLSRVPTHARIGLAAAAVILIAFVALLLVTESDRAALRRQVISAFAARLDRAGVLRSPPRRSVICQQELTYHLVCDASLAGEGGTDRFDVRYVDSGCWHAVLLSVPAAAPVVPAKLAGCS